MLHTPLTPPHTMVSDVEVSEGVPIRDVFSIGTKLKCPDYGGVLISECVVLCTGFNGVESGSEDVSLLEMCSLLGPN